MFLKAIAKFSFREIFVEIKTKINFCEILGEAQIAKIKVREMYEKGTPLPRLMMHPLRAHAPLNGITLHAPLTYRKVEASSPRIRVRNQVKFTLFVANLPKPYTKFSL